jgi:hypothetical protein
MGAAGVEVPEVAVVLAAEAVEAALFTICAVSVATGVLFAELAELTAAGEVIADALADLAALLTAAGEAAAAVAGTAAVVAEILAAFEAAVDAEVADFAASAAVAAELDAPLAALLAVEATSLAVVAAFDPVPAAA